MHTSSNSLRAVEDVGVEPLVAGRWAWWQPQAEVLAGMSDVVVLLDMKGRVVFINTAAEQCYGVSLHKLRGKAFDAVCQVAWEPPVEGASSGSAWFPPDDWVGPAWHVSRGGGKLRMKSRQHVVKNPQGLVRGRLLVSALDHEDSDGLDAKLRLAIDAANLGTWSWNVASGSGVWSARCKALAGLPADTELNRETALNSIHPEDREYLRESFRLAAEQRTDCNIEYRSLWPDGKTVRWLATLGRATYDPAGKWVGINGITLDITERKRSQEAMLRLNAELEQRVSARTAELEQVNAELREFMATRERLEAEILTVSEREQGRLGQCLHDGLGQDLAGIAMICKAIAKRLQLENHREATACESIATLISQSIRATREMARAFYPIELDPYGLLVSLQDLAAETARVFSLECAVRHSGELPELDSKTKIHLYRIVQEALANATRHAWPKTIGIDVHSGPEGVCVAVTNDGNCMQMPSPAHVGMGLHLMEYRARIIGGWLEWEAPESGGCRVRCWLPARESEDDTD